MSNKIVVHYEKVPNKGTYKVVFRIPTVLLGDIPSCEEVLQHLPNIGIGCLAVVPMERWPDITEVRLRVPELMKPHEYFQMMHLMRFFHGVVDEVQFIPIEYDPDTGESVRDATHAWSAEVGVIAIA